MKSGSKSRKANHMQPPYKRGGKTFYRNDVEELPYPDRPIAGGSKRYAAVKEVLLRLPPDAYDFLVGMAGSFAWYLPEVDGQVKRFGCIGGHVDVILLGQELERKSSRYVVATLVHELAHVVLGHLGLPEPASGVLDPATYNAFLVKRQRLEGEAWDLAEQWGSTRCGPTRTARSISRCGVYMGVRREHDR